MTKIDNDLGRFAYTALHQASPCKKRTGGGVPKRARLRITRLLADLATTALRNFDVSIPTKARLCWSMTRPPYLRLCPANPGNPRRNIEGKSPLQGRTYSLRRQLWGLLSVSAHSA